MNQYLQKLFLLPACTITMIFGSCYHATAEEQVTVDDKTIDDKKDADDDDAVDIVLISEAFGHFIGKNLNSPGVNFDLEAMIKGIRQGAAGKPAPMSDKKYEAAMAKLQERAIEKLSSDNLKAANEFIKDNANNKNVIEIEPGKLQYLTLQEGHGETVQPNSSPLIQYVGKYLDGKVFGSSQEVGGPIPISLSQTIPGFSKGLVGMKEGEKRRLFIHPDLGYGTLGNLPPNALLIFDIEIVKADSQNDDAKETPDEEDEEGNSLPEDEEDNSLPYDAEDEDEGEEDFSQSNH